MQHTLSNTATGDPAGTFAYAAPEMLMGEKWDDKVRIYCSTLHGCVVACVTMYAVGLVYAQPCLFDVTAA